MDGQEDPNTNYSLSQLPKLEKPSGTPGLCGVEDDDEEDELGEAAAALQRWALRLDPQRLTRQSPAAVASVLHVCDEEEEDEDEEERQHRRRAVSLPANPSLAAANLFHPDGAGIEGYCNCKKRVQFADAMGLTLASVHHFSASEEPQVPAAVLSRLHSFPASQQDLDALLLIGGNGWNQESPTAPPPPAFLEPDFQVLSEEEQHERLQRELVCLEQVRSELFDLRGSVLVAPPEGDPAQEEGECVSVRYTFNDWLSFLDAPAEREGPPAARRFRFTFSAPPCIDPGAYLHFAVCYREASGCEHWDNNLGQNYSLCYRPPEPT